MRAGFLLHISIVTLAMISWAVPASAESMKDFDVQKAQTWADALAICDVTKFLTTDPKLESEVIISSMPSHSQVALHRPYFIPPSSFYSDVMQETFERVRKAGLVTMNAYGAARLRYAKLMLRDYAFADATDQAFLADQMRLCYALAVDTTGRAQKSKSGAYRK